MKALVLHNAGNFRYEPAWPEPKPPDNWAIMRVRYSGICGSDLPRIMKTGAYRHPLIPGHEFAGVVAHNMPDTIHPGVAVAALPIIPCGHCAGCAQGLFFCEHYDFLGSRRDGGFAEQCALPPANLFPLPTALPLEEGTFIEPLFVTLHVLRRSGLKAGDRVLVFGAGTIGLLIAQWARILGAAEVVIADIRDPSLEIAARCGLEHALNAGSDTFAALKEFDCVFEAAGSTAALLAAIDKAAVKSRIAVIGRETKDLRIPLESFEKLMRKELDLKGCWGYDPRGEEALVSRVLADGTLKLKPLITHRITPAETPETLRRMWLKEFFYCKVIIDWGQ